MAALAAAVLGLVATAALAVGPAGPTAGPAGAALTFQARASAAGHPARFPASEAVLRGWRKGSGVAAGDASIAAREMAAADASRPLGASSNRQSSASRATNHAASLLSRFNQRVGAAAEDGAGAAEATAEDPCTGPFGDLIRAQLPPLDPHSTHMTVAFGQRFPRWQPVDRPAVQLPNVWAYAEEMRISVPEAAVLAEGWTSLEQFFSSWLADLRAVPRGQGAVGFAARMVVDRITSPIGVHPGAVLRCDLPSVAGMGVELADFEIVDVQPTLARLGTLTVVGPRDGAVYREPHSPRPAGARTLTRVPCRAAGLRPGLSPPLAPG